MRGGPRPSRAHDPSERHTPGHHSAKDAKAVTNSRLLSLAVLAMGIGLTTGLVDAQGRGAAELLDAPAGEVRFTVRFDEPQWVVDDLDGVAYRYPAWPGMGVDGHPGDPGLPGRIVRVALPGGGEPSLSLTVEPGGRSGDVRFPPIPSWVPRETIPGRREDPAPDQVLIEGAGYGVSAADAHAELSAVGHERGVRVANILVRPATWNPATGEAVWARSVTVSVRVSGASARPAHAAARPGDPEVEGWRATLLNAADASAWQIPDCDTVPQPNAPDGVPEVWFDDAQGWLKIDVDANGIYRVSRRALADAGVGVDTLDPRSLRLFAGPLLPEVGWAGLGWRGYPNRPEILAGPAWQHVYDRPDFTAGFTEGSLNEIPILVNGESDGKFDSADTIVFYALGPDNYRDRFGLANDTRADYLENPYTDHTVYWLAWGGSFPEAPKRIAQVAAAPSAGAPVLSASEARLHVEQNLSYDPSMYELGFRWETWFWDSFSSKDAPRSKQIALPHAQAESVFDARVRLWGAVIPLQYGVGEAAQHHVQIDVNDTPAPLAVWGSSGYAAYTHFDVDVSGVAARNPSTFIFTVPTVGTNPARADLVHLAWIDIVYRRELNADSKAGEIEVDAGDVGRTVRIARPPAGTPVVLDVTDPRNPRELTGGVTAGSGTTATLEFAMDRAGSAVVAFAPASGVPVPAKLSLKTEPRLRPGGSDVRWLRDTREPIDYVIIAYDDFTEEAEILAAWRRAHLYEITDTREARVRVVRVSDIMDEFTHGMWDPTALRLFLEYAYRYYGACGIDDRLSYCLFLGDHTYDFRDHEQTGIKDFVPSWEDNRLPLYNIADGNVQYVSDDPLARFEGPSDVFTELYIGRITATSRQEARDVIVDKVIRSENEPSYGAWRAKAILVADDICQAKETDTLRFRHMQQTEDLDAAIPAAMDRQKVYLYEYGEECIYDSKPDAKRALLRAWSEGAWFVNYFGHGADVVLAQEHVMDLADVPALANDNRLPVFSAFSCSVGKFSKTAQQGLGEALVLADGTGALVSAAATQLTESGANGWMSLRFMDEMFPDPADFSLAAPAGVALMRAKRISGGDDKYVCLGDPASRINVPERSLSLQGPDRLERGSLVDVRVGMEGVGTGDLDVLAQDARVMRDQNAKGEPIGRPYYLPGATVYRGTTALAADTSHVRFTVPVALRGGLDGRVRIYASGEGWDGVGTLVLPVVPQSSASRDTLGPVITLSATGAALRVGQQVEIVLEDPAGINLTGIFEFLSVQLKVFDEKGLERTRQDITSRFAYESGSATRGRVVFPVPDLEAGRYTFLVSAADNYNNRTQVSLEVRIGEGSGGNGFTSVAAYPNPFDPDGEPTRVLFTLEEPAEVTVRVYSVAGRLVRRGSMDAAAGGNAFAWDGKDEAGDVVANGVYLVQLTAKGEGGTRSHLERLAVVR
jgi:hypothetical protein